MIFQAEGVRQEGQEPKDNRRFVITNLPQSPPWIYGHVYCARGQTENPIQELHYGLEIDRTSCKKFLANPFRVLMTAAAYVPGDQFSKKLVYSSFYGTFTDTLLRNMGVKNLIAVGFAANACLHTTLTEAMYRNYRVVLLHDCTAGMECDGTYRDMTLTKAFLRFIETHVGYTSTSDEFAAACSKLA